MLKKLIKHLWTFRREFAKYFIVGISGVVIDMGLLVLFKEVFAIPPVWAVVIIQLLMIVYIFLLNKYWSFRNKEVDHRQLVRFLILAGFNYLFSVLVMYIFNDLLGFEYKLVRLATIAVMVSWNFFLYKHWVYANNSHILS
jgi:putative flippase GtrA